MKDFERWVDPESYTSMVLLHGRKIGILTTAVDRLDWLSAFVLLPLFSPFSSLTPPLLEPRFSRFVCLGLFSGNARTENKAKKGEKNRQKILQKNGDIARMLQFA